MTRVHSALTLRPSASSELPPLPARRNFQPIILGIILIPRGTYYSRNYSGIIDAGLLRESRPEKIIGGRRPRSHRGSTPLAVHGFAGSVEDRIAGSVDTLRGS